MRVSLVAGMVMCSLLSGCDQAALLKKFTPPEGESLARSYVEMLREGKFEQIQHDLDPGLAGSGGRDTFAKMAEFFPPGEPASAKVVGAHVFHGPGKTTTDITLEYEFPSRWVLAQVAIQKNGDISTITGFHVQPIPDSLENLNRFTLVGKSALQYLTLICAVSSFLFTLYAFVLSARDKDMKPKWLWMIIALVGVGKFAVNWGSTEWTYQVIAVQIPTISLGHALYGPWTVAAYVPLGAIVFLHRRWMMRVRGQPIPPVSTRETKTLTQ